MSELRSAGRGGVRGLLQVAGLAEAAVERAAQRVFAWVVAEVEPEAVHHIGEGDLAVGIGEGEGAPGSRVTKSARARAKAECAKRSRVAEREGGVHLEDPIAPSPGRRTGVPRQLVQRPAAESQLGLACGERRVGPSDA